MHRPSVLRSSGPGALALAALLQLSACGGGSDGVTAAAPAPSGNALAPVTEPTPAPAPAPAPVSTILAGTVAVGAPITGGTLRILDADGAVVAADVPIDADGRYAGVALTGPAPWRIEACGHAGPNYLCVYSVASAGGTANVTPLTSAAVLLAAGQSPGALMSGTAPALTSESMATAQTQLRASLAGVLSNAGVASGFDFVSGTLAAGSRSGYDGVLDALGVTIGQDARAFVQITPRLGVGNLYLEQGNSSGSVTGSASAASLGLAGLEVLFRDMNAALVSAAACGSDAAGLRRSMASNASMSMGESVAEGPAQVAQALCGYFAQGDGGTPIWGAKLLSPTLGRCDLSGAAPVGGVSFVLQSPEGDVVPVGNGMSVTREDGAWKFMGESTPAGIHASAKAQRSVRIDGGTAVADYDRALAFEVSALPGLACAGVAQRDAAGDAVTIGYYKRHAGAEGQRRLSLWTSDTFGNAPSLDPLAGATRSADDTWIGLPQGAAGDALIRNFYRGGRSVVVSLYADAACGTPFAIAGRSAFEVDVDGVPPVWSAMEALPWPEIDDASSTALRTLTVGSGATGSLRAAWTFGRGPLGLNGATVCAGRADCGQGGAGRLGDRSLRPGARDATVALANRGPALGAGDAKTLALYGRTGEGVDLQSNYSTCPSVAAGESCH